MMIRHNPGYNGITLATAQLIDLYAAGETSAIADALEDLHHRQHVSRSGLHMAIDYLAGLCPQTDPKPFQQLIDLL